MMFKFLVESVSRGLVLLAVALCGLTISASAQVDRGDQGSHILNLTDVEMSAFIEDVSIVTGYTFVVHPQVRGRVTVTSQTPMTAAQVFDVFLATLKVHSFVAVPAGNRTYRIVPEQAAVSEADVSGQSRSGAFVTQVIRLNYFDAVEAAQMIKPLINPVGQVSANTNNNTLVVVDYASNMPRIRQMIDQLDADNTSVQTLPLSNIGAKEMEAILNGLNDEYSLNFTAVGAESANAVVIRGESGSVERALRVARELDSAERIRDNIRVITLDNAKAEDILPVLERIGTAMSAQAGPEGAQTAAPTIAFHEATNSLVISADYDVLNAMERVVQQLDVRRPQVMVEALVVEMSDTAVEELGLQFVVSGTGGDIPFASTNFTRSAPNILALTGALVNGGDLLGSGSTTGTSSFQDAAISSLLGLDGLTIGGGGVSGNTLFGVIVNAVESDVNSNILSTPQLMVVDNETSSIIVGQEIPIATGEVLGANNANPFRTIERKDVGVQLDVTPQIGEGDSVRLTIFQEASNIASIVGGSTGEIITNKRSIETTVIADNGEIIVLGGLIEQTLSNSESRVPLLGDLPGVGPLFRSTGQTRAKRNLMVFIRPTIVRDVDDVRRTTAGKYNYIRAQELLRNEAGVSEIDRFIGEVLGATVPSPAR